MDPNSVEGHAFNERPSEPPHSAPFQIRRKPVQSVRDSSNSCRHSDEGQEEARRVEEDDDRPHTESTPMKHGFGLPAGSPSDSSTEDSRTPCSKALRHVKTSLRWWYLEVISILAAIACLVGIIVVLRQFDGKRQDSWSSSVLTLNSLVALLATFCRTFFMIAVGAALAQGKWLQLPHGGDGDRSIRLGLLTLFEEASKGPWGSTRLIWHSKGRNLSCIGAIVSIFSLAFSVFSQQLISLRTDVVLSSTLKTGDVPRATNLRSSSQSNGNLEFMKPTVTVPMTQMNAILNGITSQSIDWPPVNCPSGNCTWPIVPTLGVCGACVNTTDRIQSEFVPAKGEYVRCRLTSEDQHSNTSVYIEAPCYGVGWLENSTSLSWPEEPVLFSSGPGTGAVFESDKAPSSGEDVFLLTHFSAIGIETQPEFAEPIRYVLENSQAMDCALWLCVQAHNISVVNGEQREEVIEISHEKGDKWGLAASDVFPKDFNVDARELYAFDSEALPQYFEKVTNGTARGRPADFTITENRDFLDIVWKNMEQADDWIERLAHSMSNEIRVAGSKQYVLPDIGTWTKEQERGIASRVKDHYRGQVLVEEVLVVVRWEWIVYPAAMVTLSLVFLLIRIVQTACRRDVRGWKDDSLVSVYLSLDPSLQAQFREGLENPDGMASAVGKHEVEVDRDDDGIPRGFRAKKD